MLCETGTSFVGSYMRHIAHVNYICTYLIMSIRIVTSAAENVSKTKCILEIKPPSVFTLPFRSL